MTAKRFALVAVVSAALAALLTTAVWAASRSTTSGSVSGNGYGGPGMMGGGSGTGMMGGYGTGMMGGHGAGMMGGYGLPGDGRRVDTLDEARQRAQAFADTLGLRVGEVMQFSNGFYAELITVDGRGATEVLVNPRGGGVQLEYGPAMMWNTSYGMHRTAVSGAARISPVEAQAIAQRWLDDQRPGLRAGEPEEFPGYVTFDTLRDGKTTGMMSVNTATGAVWYHTWHGQYLAMSED
jgi:hypothetical protein